MRLTWTLLKLTLLGAFTLVAIYYIFKNTQKQISYLYCYHQLTKSYFCSKRCFILIFLSFNDFKNSKLNLVSLALLEIIFVCSTNSFSLAAFLEIFLGACFILFWQGTTRIWWTCDTFCYLRQIGITSWCFLSISPLTIIIRFISVIWFKRTQMLHRPLIWFLSLPFILHYIVKTRSLAFFSFWWPLPEQVLRIIDSRLKRFILFYSKRWSY